MSTRPQFISSVHTNMEPLLVLKECAAGVQLLCSLLVSKRVNGADKTQQRQLILKLKTQLE